MNNENILIIGYYDRKNIGDECYKIAFPLLFKDAKKITFVCSDDIEIIPEEITTVICGGGDIINDYFMKKIHELLKVFKGNIYAVSVGIPYINAAKYLHIFDHIFVRSQNDYDVAVKEIGNENLTVIRDISQCIPLMLASPSSLCSQILETQEKNSMESERLASSERHVVAMGGIPLTYIEKKPTEKIRIGIALAQPYFYENPNKFKLIKSLLNVFIKLYKKNENIEYHFLNFNYHDSHQENDRIINLLIIDELILHNIPFTMHDELTSPNDMLNYINNFIDLTLCMRYHAVMFSLITNKRFVPLFLSSKIKNILKDVDYDTRFVVELPANNNYQPTKINETQLFNALNIATKNLDYIAPKYNDEKNSIYTDITNKILIQKKLSNILIHNKFRSFEDVLVSCKRALEKYLHINHLKYDDLLKKRGPFPIKNKNPLEVARFICFIISGKTHHPCVWGLADKLLDLNFQLFESISFIWQTCKINHEDIEKKQSYYPQLQNLNRKVFFNLDYIFQNDFSEYHRSGWSYVVGGLMNLDAQHLSRQSDIMLDTYLDRSFHWGYSILKYIGVVPYVKPWYGFIHHTFNVDHSEYNCSNLLKNNDFIESLKCCKGLFVLSEYLAKQFRDAFIILNINVLVHVLYHPTEFVNNNFTIEKFTNNKNKKIVQIGAWLRNPYAIYELQLPQNNNLKISKVALKGKEMDQYFPPPNFLESIENILINNNCCKKSNSSINIICRDGNNNSDSDNDNDNINCDVICRPGVSSINKFCKGLYESITDQLKSVTILDKLNNDDYDNLLSENIIFLNLVDCSAVNTVIECIVRNTPLLVNKLPSLIEVLGENYPGFYNNLNDVVDICKDINKISEISKYISMLDKSRYNLDIFIEHLQDYIEKGYSNKNFELIQEQKLELNQELKQELFTITKNEINNNVNIFINKYSKLLKFLPITFLKYKI
jgi:hypothetical protein